MEFIERLITPSCKIFQIVCVAFTRAPASIFGNESFSAAATGQSDFGFDRSNAFIGILHALIGLAINVYREDSAAVFLGNRIFGIASLHFSRHALLAIGKTDMSHKHMRLKPNHGSAQLCSLVGRSCLELFNRARFRFLFDPALIPSAIAFHDANSARCIGTLKLDTRGPHLLMTVINITGDRHSSAQLISLEIHHGACADIFIIIHLANLLRNSTHKPQSAQGLRDVFIKILDRNLRAALRTRALRHRARAQRGESRHHRT